MIDETFLQEIYNKGDDEYLSLDEISYLTRISPNTIRSAIYDSMYTLRQYAVRINNVWRVKKCDALKWAETSNASRLTIDEITNLLIKRKKQCLSTYKNRILKKQIENDSDEYVTRSDIVELIMEAVEAHQNDEYVISDIDLSLLIDISIAFIKRNVDIFAVDIVFKRIFNNNAVVKDYGEVIGTKSSKNMKTLVQFINSSSFIE